MLETETSLSRFKTEVMLLVKDFQDISADTDSYEAYHRTRQAVIQDLLAKTSLN
jgi:hypothetical protein